MTKNLTRQPSHELDTSISPKTSNPPKRKPSARAPWEDKEIPIILDSLKGRYRVRNQALIACNVVWGLRAHEMLGVRMGDILNIAADGSWTFKEDFMLSGARLKGGKPRSP
jgi:integrase